MRRDPEKSTGRFSLERGGCFLSTRKSIAQRSIRRKQVPDLTISANVFFFAKHLINFFLRHRIAPPSSSRLFSHVSLCPFTRALFLRIRTNIRCEASLRRVERRDFFFSPALFRSLTRQVRPFRDFRGEMFPNATTLDFPFLFFV